MPPYSKNYDEKQGEILDQTIIPFFMRSACDILAKLIPFFPLVLIISKPQIIHRFTHSIQLCL